MSEAKTPEPEQSPAPVFGLPAGAWQHFRQARIELLKGLRVLIDQRIESISRGDERKGTRITVE
jgi:hypothetical protein